MTCFILKLDPVGNRLVIVCGFPSGEKVGRFSRDPWLFSPAAPTGESAPVRRSDTSPYLAGAPFQARRAPRLKPGRAR